MEEADFIGKYLGNHHINPIDKLAISKYMENDSTIKKIQV